MLFCSKGESDLSEKNNVTFKLWDGEELKTATSLIKQSNTKKALVGFNSSVSETREIDIEYEDTLDDYWNFISLSEYSIKSQVSIRSDRHKLLFCTYSSEDEGHAAEDLEIPKPIFLLEKFDFSEKKK